MKVFCFMLNYKPPQSIKLVKVVSESFRIFQAKDLSHLRGLSGYCYNEYSEGKNVMFTLFLSCKYKVD